MATGERVAIVPFTHFIRSDHPALAALARHPLLSSKVHTERHGLLLALALVYEKAVQGNASFWRPYIRTLPSPEQVLPHVGGV